MRIFWEIPLVRMRAYRELKIMEFEEPQAGASLLDLLLVVAENLKLLLLGPLLVGLVGLVALGALPQTYQSESYLSVSDGGQGVIAVMKTPAVLDSVLSQTQAGIIIANKQRDRAINKFRFKAASSQKTGALIAKFEVDGDSPAAAQSLANALIDAWLLSTLPKPVTKVELERKLKLSKESFDAVSKLIDRQTSESAKSTLPSLQFDVASSVAQLLQLRNGYVDSIAATELALRGVSRDVIESPPTLPTEPVSNKNALIAIMATLGTGFALLLFVFIRQAWRDAAQDPEAAPKVARLRAAFGRKNVVGK